MFKLVSGVGTYAILATTAASKISDLNSWRRLIPGHAARAETETGTN